MKIDLDKLRLGEIAAMFGVSRSTVHEWRRVHGGFPPARHGRSGWRWAEVREWWLEHRGRARSAAAGVAGVPPIQESQARRQAAAAAREETRLALERRELVPVSEVRGLVRESLERVKGAMIAAVADGVIRSGVKGKEAGELEAVIVSGIRAAAHDLPQLGEEG